MSAQKLEAAIETEEVELTTLLHEMTQDYDDGTAPNNINEVASYRYINRHDGPEIRRSYKVIVAYFIALLIGAVFYHSHPGIATADELTALQQPPIVAPEGDTPPDKADSSGESVVSGKDYGLTVADINSKRTSSATTADGTILQFTPTAATQISSYKQGKALIVAIHITHHAGTAFCKAIGDAPGQTGSPSFACMGLRPGDGVTIDNYPKENPWTHDATAQNIALVRPFFHMISWEFSAPRPGTELAMTDWENPNLVSVIVMRDPLARLLAGDGSVNTLFPGINDGTAAIETWWEYANTTRGYTNNFAMHVLAGQDCCQGEETDPKHLRAAKKLVGRLTFVLDMDCLDKGMDALAHILGFERNRRELEEWAQGLDERDLSLHHTHPPPEERIPYKEVYDFLVRRNHLDIELYKWSKEISLVKCADLHPPTQAPSAGGL
jgi:hypothetical protein